MPVVVRLPEYDAKNSRADKYEDHYGCKECGYCAHNRGFVWSPDDDICPRCESKWFNRPQCPRVEENDDGSLTVFRDELVVGRYPAGEWKMWRQVWDEDKDK